MINNIISKIARVKAPLVIVPTPPRIKGVWVPVPDLRYCWALVADTEAPKDPNRTYNTGPESQSSGLIGGPQVLSPDGHAGPSYKAVSTFKFTMWTQIWSS